MICIQQEQLYYLTELVVDILYSAPYTVTMSHSHGRNDLE